MNTTHHSLCLIRMARESWKGGRLLASIWMKHPTCCPVKPIEKRLRESIAQLENGDLIERELPQA